MQHTGKEDRKGQAVAVLDENHRLVHQVPGLPEGVDSQQKHRAFKVGQHHLGEDLSLPRPVQLGRLHALLGKALELEADDVNANGVENGGKEHREPGTGETQHPEKEILRSKHHLNRQHHQQHIDSEQPPHPSGAGAKEGVSRRHRYYNVEQDHRQAHPHRVPEHPQVGRLQEKGGVLAHCSPAGEEGRFHKVQAAPRQPPGVLGKDRRGIPPGSFRRGHEGIGYRQQDGQKKQRRQRQHQEGAPPPLPSGQKGAVPLPPHPKAIGGAFPGAPQGQHGQGGN